MTNTLPQRLAAILAADIAGYTALMEHDESAMVQAWRRARAEVIDPTVARHQGRIVKLTGDGFLAEFPTVESAVRAALAMQEAFRKLFADAPPEHPIAFRMGVNIGDIWVDSDDIYGAGVNIAARLEALADPGDVCISGAARDAIKHKITARYEDMGLQRVKNVAEPVHAWQIRHAEATSTVSRVGRPAAAVQPAANEAVAASATPRRRRWQLAAALLLLAAVATASTLTLWPDRPSAYSLAVLPFRPLIPEQSHRELELGLTDTLITELIQAGLKVAPYTSVMRYANVDEDPLEAGRELGVRGVLATAIQYAGDDLSRVTLQLYDVASGETLWLGTLDQQLSDNTLKMQEEIANGVVAKLPSDIVGVRDPRAVKRGTADSEAYELYVKGRGAAADRTPQALLRAIDYFTKAIERDPRYAQAFAARADAYAVRGVFGATVPKEAFDHARADADKALELDADLAAANATMGHINVQYDHDWAAGERRYRKAIALDAEYAMTYMWLGMLYNYRLDFDEALKHMRKAEELEPDSAVFRTNTGTVLYYAHRYDEAIEQLKRALEIDESFDLALAHLGRAYLHKGDVKLAIGTFERRRAQMFGYDSDLIQAYASDGRLEDARARLALLLEKRNSTTYVPAYDIAASYMGLGEKEQALQWLGEAVQERSQHVPHLPADPAFADLHGQPRFEELVRSLGLAQ